MTGILQGALSIELGGHALWLLPQRALWWPGRALLAVADVHLGKAATFRALGMPVPAGTTAENLSALDGILQLTGARRLVFLGDLIHARPGRSASLMQALRDWRQRHAGLDMSLVRGNHDARAGDPPPELGITVVDEPWREECFLFCHHPQSTSGDDIAVAGHLHPVFTLAQGHERLRLPCFLMRPGCLVLPAFGAFTGGYAARPGQDDQVFLVTHEAVHALPSRQSTRR